MWAALFSHPFSKDLMIISFWTALLTYLQYSPHGFTSIFSNGLVSFGIEIILSATLSDVLNAGSLQVHPDYRNIGFSIWVMKDFFFCFCFSLLENSVWLKTDWMFLTKEGFVFVLPVMWIVLGQEVYSSESKYSGEPGNFVSLLSNLEDDLVGLNLINQ